MVSAAPERCSSRSTIIVIDVAAEVAETAEANRAAGGEALAVRNDAADNDSVAEAVQTVVERYGGLDIYYANAGITGERKPKLGRTPKRPHDGSSSVSHRYVRAVEPRV